jgi:hypothetical protein
MKHSGNPFMSPFKLCELVPNAPLKCGLAAIGANIILAPVKGLKTSPAHVYPTQEVTNNADAEPLAAQASTQTTK